MERKKINEKKKFLTIEKNNLEAQKGEKTNKKETLIWRGKIKTN